MVLRQFRTVLGGLGLLALSYLAAATTAIPVPGTPAPPDLTKATTHVVKVYYFRTNTRCTSCRKIEAYTDAAVKGAFDKELGKGHVVWQVVNVQEPPNAHFIRDYQLAAKSVVIVDTVDGNQVRWKNLPRIWELLDDEPGFARYIQEEVRGYLEGRS